MFQLKIIFYLIWYLPQLPVYSSYQINNVLILSIKPRSSDNKTSMAILSSNSSSTTHLITDSILQKLSFTSDILMIYILLNATRFNHLKPKNPGHAPFHIHLTRQVCLGLEVLASLLSRVFSRLAGSDPNNTQQAKRSKRVNHVHLFRIRLSTES